MSWALTISLSLSPSLTSPPVYTSANVADCHLFQLRRGTWNASSVGKLFQTRMRQTRGVAVFHRNLEFSNLVVCLLRTEQEMFCWANMSFQLFASTGVPKGKVYDDVCPTSSEKKREHGRAPITEWHISNISHHPIVNKKSLFRVVTDFELSFSRSL